jgi:hypothetical protein
MKDEQYVITRRSEMVIRIVEPKEFRQRIVSEGRGTLVEPRAILPRSENTTLQDFIVVAIGVAIMLALSWTLVFSMQLVLNKL